MRTRRLLLPVLALSLALAGCSGSDSDSDARPTPTVTEEAEKNPDKARTPVADEPTDEPTVEETEEPEEPPAGDSNAVLDAFIAAERATIPQIMESMGDLYDAVEINPAYPNGVEYAYVYREPLDAVAAAGYFDGMLDTLQTMCDTAVFPAMERAGISNPSITYTYRNPDGSEIWSHTFTS